MSIFTTLLVRKSAVTTNRIRIPFLATLMLCLSLNTLSAWSQTEEVKRGGILTKAASRQGVLIPNFNPFSPQALHSTFGPLYEPLLFANSHKAEIQPWLAKSWSWSEDLLSLTLTLQDSVTWHDGLPLGMQDVVFSINLGRDNPALDQANLWQQGLSSVEVIDDQTLTLVFDNVNTTLLPRLGNLYILPEHIWKNIEDPVSYTSEENPIGSGPFLFDLARFSEQSYRITRNPNYWQLGTDGEPLPYIDAIQYVSVTGNEQGAMRMIAGDLDWGAYFMANIDRTFVRRNQEHHKYWLPEGNMVYLNFNNAKPPFDDPAFRRAISMAIDPQEITRIMASGASAAPQSGLKQSHIHWLPQSTADYAFSYDVAAAKTALNNLGYRLNDRGILEREGQALSFSLYVPSGWTDWITGMDVVSRQLKAIGIEARVSQVAWPSPFLTQIAEGNYDLSVDYVTYGFSPYYQFDSMLASRHYAPLGETSPSSHSHMRYLNENVDNAFAQYRQTDQPAKQQEAMDVILTAVMRDTPMLPLFFNPTWFQYSTERFSGWPDAQNDYTAPRTARMEKMPILLRLQPTQ